MEYYLLLYKNFSRHQKGNDSMGNESFRVLDMKLEQILADFMDRNFYSKIRGLDGKKVDYRRIKDLKTQRAGVDVELHFDKKTIRIDEKASLKFCNSMIPTFAFELDSIQNNSNQPIIGWFLNKELLTDYYMLIWPNIKCEGKKARDKKKESNCEGKGNNRKEKDGKCVEDKCLKKSLEDLVEDDFTILEAYLIKKQKLIKAVEKKGWSKKRLMDEARKFRRENQGIEKPNPKILNNVFKLCLSGFLAERPVNLVINKSFLKKVASRIYLISNDGYAMVEKRLYGSSI